MRRLLGIVLAAGLTLGPAGCDGDGAEKPLEIIDPRGDEFGAARVTARARLTEIEKAIRDVSGRGVVGTREAVGCLTGNKGPKGQPDVWDSQCWLQRSLGLFPADPVAQLLLIDKKLVALGYPGRWYQADLQTEIRPADVAAGRVPARLVAQAGYGDGAGVGIRFQLARQGEKQQLIRQTPRESYFAETGNGRDWESVVPKYTTLTRPVIAVELTMEPFIRRPETA